MQAGTVNVELGRPSFFIRKAFADLAGGDDAGAQVGVLGTRGIDLGRRCCVAGLEGLQAVDRQPRELGLVLAAATGVVRTT